MKGAEELVRQREFMVSRQLEARGIRDPQVLNSMRSVPRHEFVPTDLLDEAYRDGPLPIGRDQTISQPYMVALMTQSARLRSSDRVLEVGTGCGYQTAILAEIVARVFTLERIPELADQAHLRLRALGYHNVSIAQGDGTLGWSDHQPYQAIVVTAGAPSVPQPLLDQLAPGGRLVIPIQSGRAQTLCTYTRTEDGFDVHRGDPCTFVPLIGRHGWAE